MREGTTVGLPTLAQQVTCKSERDGGVAEGGERRAAREATCVKPMARGGEL